MGPSAWDQQQLLSGPRCVLKASLSKIGIIWFPLMIKFGKKSSQGQKNKVRSRFNIIVKKITCGPKSQDEIPSRKTSNGTQQ